MQLFLEIILIKKFHADCAALKAPPCGSYLRIVTKENPKQRAACIMHPVVMLNSGQKIQLSEKNSLHKQNIMEAQSFDWLKLKTSHLNNFSVSSGSVHGIWTTVLLVVEGKRFHSNETSKKEEIF